MTFLRKPVHLVVDYSLSDATYTRSIGNSNLELLCVDCDISYNFNIGMEFDVQGTSVTAISMNVTVQQFEQAAVVQISMNQTLQLDTSVDVFKYALPGTSVRNYSLSAKIFSSH